MYFHAFFSLNTKGKSFTTKRFLFWEREDFETEPTLNEIFEKVSVLLSWSCAVSSEEFVAVEDVCTAPMMADKDILEFAQGSKNIIEAYSDDENGTNNAATVPISSEIRSITKSMHSYLDVHSIVK
ncbi:SCAN domain-containing protein 3 [Trichonephila clavipes]|nr:SCAN domain-containing protein 3 [Trichonephila clavipes]